ncbi:MAG: PEP-CTERM sorting domain-containing protein [Planctomycetota bacterium]|jgi:hypothetical protein
MRAQTLQTIVAIAGVASLGPSVALAGQISTTFVSNGGIPPGGAAYFDVTVAANPLEITSFLQNSEALLGEQFSFEVFTTPGTYVGNETNAAVWTSRATGFGTGHGVGDSQDQVVIDNPFTLDAEASYGMAVVLADVWQKRTAGDGLNQHYENLDVALDLGTITLVAFEGTVFTPRVWNGAINYNVVPEPTTLSPLALGGLLVARRRR